MHVCIHACCMHVCMYVLTNASLYVTVYDLADIVSSGGGAGCILENISMRGKNELSQRAAPVLEKGEKQSPPLQQRGRPLRFPDPLLPATFSSSGGGTQVHPGFDCYVADFSEDTEQSRAARSTAREACEEFYIAFLPAASLLHMVQLKNIFYRAASPPKKNLDCGVGLVLTPGPDNGLYVKFIVENVRCNITHTVRILGALTFLGGDASLINCH